MTSSFKVNTFSAFFLGYFVIMVIYWVALQVLGVTDQPINLFYSFALNTLAFLGGVSGIIVSKQWGGLKSIFGRGLFFISLGLVSWGAVGGYTWSFYNFVLNHEVPYPSFSDVGFVGAILFWAIGMFYLAQATGVRYGLRKSAGKLYLVLLPVLSFALSYYLLVTIARDGVLTDGGEFTKIFFDFAYPIGDVVIITIALLIYGLTMKLLGGLYKSSVNIMLLGFVVMFFADMAFSYSTTVETYFNGNYADLLFVIALSLMSYGVASFRRKEVASA